MQEGKARYLYQIKVTPGKLLIILVVLVDSSFYHFTATHKGSAHLIALFRNRDPDSDCPAFCRASR